MIESGSACSQLRDAIDRAKLDTFRLVVILDAFDARVSVDYVSVLADAHRFGRAFGPAGVTIDAVFGNCISHFEVSLEITANGFAQKVDPIWNEPVGTGSAGALARRMRSTLNLKLLDAATVSRFALIAGEGARAPSISLSLSAIPLFGQGHSEQFMISRCADLQPICQRLQRDPRH